MDAAARPEPVRAVHPFEERPNRTLVALSVPVMLSLVAEPLAGVVDTAFVEGLGAPAAAGLGAATTLLSGVLWIFNFLGVGTQTEVAHVAGGAESSEAGRIATLAMGVALALGALAAALAWPAVDLAAAFMSDEPAVRSATATYLEIRLLGFPATLALFAAFGALRGLQQMRAPMWIACALSLANVVLDALLIFGWGPVPALGIAGAAWATVASQVFGSVLACGLVIRRLGFRFYFEPARVVALFVVGRDLMIRTSALLLFMLIATRVSLQMGAEAGAAHQAIRQLWMLLAFLLDAWAASAQSLIAWFLGAGRLDQARRVARVSLAWALGTGAVLSVLLGLAESSVAVLLVPEDARAIFASAWPVFVLSQPLCALSFATDGIHWGARDYRYLRNAMLAASAAGLFALLALDPAPPARLDRVWAVTVGWIAIRSALGVLRIWPGLGRAPLSTRRTRHRDPSPVA
jgi:MATE family multidrug resistance protein